MKSLFSNQIFLSLLVTTSHSLPPKNSVLFPFSHPSFPVQSRAQAKKKKEKQKKSFAFRPNHRALTDGTLTTASLDINHLARPRAQRQQGSAHRLAGKHHHRRSVGQLVGVPTKEHGHAAAQNIEASLLLLHHCEAPPTEAGLLPRPPARLGALRVGVVVGRSRHGHGTKN
ncbi:hypothetical protein COCNU_02G000550 [Cocos nucifera]|uniref:Uncharacterized protein n=1 Tax=Cocos nucifera TaxID=13894 RepID=A0A8K0HY95_COCNU|nr:hypothetical protein COCNU_02G000550 [Cocos nucifera]